MKNSSSEGLFFSFNVAHVSVPVTMFQFSRNGNVWALVYKWPKYHCLQKWFLSSELSQIHYAICRCQVRGLGGRIGKKRGKGHKFLSVPSSRVGLLSNSICPFDFLPPQVSSHAPSRPLTVRDTSIALFSCTHHAPHLHLDLKPLLPHQPNYTSTESVSGVQTRQVI